MKQIIVLCILSLTGCAGVFHEGATHVVLPNGARGGVLKCEHKTDCYKYAQRVCVGSYKILQADDVPTGDFATSAGEVDYVIQCDNNAPMVSQ